MLEGVVNFRDLGGHRTASGATVRTEWIYRSAHFSEATDADIAELERRNVKVFIDFRGPGDIEADGHNRMPDGARLVSIPMTGRPAVIYCRVSDIKQTIRGDGLNSQETRCREYAKGRGYTVK